VAALQNAEKIDFSVEFKKSKMIEFLVVELKYFANLGFCQKDAITTKPSIKCLKVIIA
jgi:HKD family nuclease